MVPVLDINLTPLMPCTEKRARLLMERKQAIPYWQKGIFCIKLTKQPSDRKYQKVVLGVDPGSKREGYTVITETKVVLNITSDTPNWVKENIEIRRNLRRNRRNRKTPYRKMRANRASLRKLGRVSPSTKARWDAKLRIINILRRILPITIINVEDIQAKTKEGKKKWNISFSPLEVGKKYFYAEILKLVVKLIKTSGIDTSKHRKIQGYKKDKKNKLKYIWGTHNVDSHVLCEMAFGKTIKPFRGMIQLNFLKYNRRQIHIQNPIKGNIRKLYGGTVSLGMSRGSVLKYKDKIYYLGGSSKGMVSIHSIETGKRISQNVKIEEIHLLYHNKWRINYIGVSNSSST